MIRTALAFVATLAAGPALASDLVLHEVLQEQPLTDVPDLKTVISRVTLKPGGEMDRHVHPGDSFLVVVEGGPVTLDDGSTVRFEPGESMFHAAGDVHGGFTNEGTTDIVLIATYVVNIYEPFAWPAE